MIFVSHEEREDQMIAFDFMIDILLFSFVDRDLGGGC